MGNIRAAFYRLPGHSHAMRVKEQPKNNFGQDPPNATLSVYEPGKPDSTLVVLEITNPAVDGQDLIYRYRIIDGTMPANGGPTALFIDWIGVGGGVGRGYRGVGVGRRGPGM